MLDKLELLEKWVIVVIMDFKVSMDALVHLVNLIVQRLLRETLDMCTACLACNLDASDIVDQGYFDAWRGHHQISKSSGFILRQYVHDDNQELSQNTDNFTEETFNRRQFNIRRGPVLSVWTTDRKQNVIKFEEHDEK